jgi:uncharacterized protein YjbJ (UPF0337 family)
MRARASLTHEGLSANSAAEAQDETEPLAPHARSAQPPPERTKMTDQNVDEAKGRAKEAAGAVTDDKDLKREGKADQAKSSVKHAVDRAAETAKSLLGRTRK